MSDEEQKFNLRVSPDRMRVLLDCKPAIGNPRQLLAQIEVAFEN